MKKLSNHRRLIVTFIKKTKLLNKEKISLTLLETLVGVSEVTGGTSPLLFGDGTNLRVFFAGSTSSLPCVTTLITNKCFPKSNLHLQN